MDPGLRRDDGLSDNNIEKDTVTSAIAVRLPLDVYVNVTAAV
jgi:hypothetical protein